MEGAALWRVVTVPNDWRVLGLDFAQLHRNAGPAPMTEMSDISSARS